VWQVNFNLSRQPFEPNIRARNLLNLALSSTAFKRLPRFVFTLSVSVVGFRRHEKRLKEVPVNLKGAVTSIRDAQSKLVAEKIYLAQSMELIHLTG
jgi:nucleoside-diphosphate-sugar epimerase